MSDLLNSTALSALETPANFFVGDNLDRLDGGAEKERARGQADADEAKRLRSVWMDAQADLDRYDHENAGKPVVGDIDPDTGERIPDPPVIDADGNVIKRSRYSGTDHARASARLRLVHISDKAEEAYRKAQKQVTDHSPFVGNANSLVRHANAARDWLNSQPPGMIFDQFDPGKGFKPDHAKMVGLGEKAVQKAADIAEAEGAALPLDEINARIDAYVDDPPFPGRLLIPHPQRVDSRGKMKPLDVHWSPKALRGVEAKNPHVVPVMDDAVAMLLWLAPDAVREALKDQARAAYSDGRLALPEGERRKRLNKLRADLHQIELQEAAHFWGLADSGVDLVPRKGLSPRALLQIV